MNSETTFKWIPLESNAEVFNEYFYSLGMPRDLIFYEAYTLDTVDYIDGEIKAVIVNQMKIVNDKQIYHGDCFLHSNSLDFYMIQDDTLYNACGLVAGLHAVMNSADNKDNFQSLLKDISVQTKMLDYQSRCEVVAKNEVLNSIHNKFACFNSSSCNLSEVTQHHYVTFIKMNNVVYELDGRLKFPYIHKVVDSSLSFFDQVSLIIKERLQRNHIAYDMSMLILASST